MQRELYDGARNRWQSLDDGHRARDEHGRTSGMSVGELRRHLEEIDPMRATELRRLQEQDPSLFEAVVESGFLRNLPAEVVKTLEALSGEDDRLRGASASKPNAAIKTI